MSTKDKKGQTPESAQQSLPGVLENVEEFPELTAKLKQLKRARVAYAREGGKAKELGDEVRSFMHEKEILVYYGDGITVKRTPGKEKLEIELGDSSDETQG